MAWFDELFLPPGTTYPIPSMVPPNIPFKYGIKDQGTAGLHSAIYGSPFIPTPFDVQEIRPGVGSPGQLDLTGKTVKAPPMMGRQPSPATMPMPGTLPEGANPPGAMGMGDLSYPGAVTPPTSPQAATPARKSFDWSADASLWPMLMQAGQGLMQPSPYGFAGQLQQGLAGATQAAMFDPERRLKRAQVGKVEAENERSRDLSALYSDKSLPMALRLAARTGDMGKFADAYMKLDPDTQRALAQNEAVKAAMVSAATLGDRMKIAEVAAGKAPAGYRWGPDGKLETIPGGPATHISADVAGRLAMMRTAQADLQKSRDVFLKEWSAKDIANAQISAGDIGRAQRNVTLAIEAALRAMTGAAAPDSEVRKYEGMFMPKTYDTLETRKQKLALLEGFINNAMQIATQGRGDLPALPTPPPAAPAAKPKGRSGTLPGGIKWSEE